LKLKKNSTAIKFVVRNRAKQVTAFAFEGKETYGFYLLADYHRKENWKKHKYLVAGTLVTIVGYY
jgi:hypothetical protein